MSKHLKDNASDRDRGHWAELRFCTEVAPKFGRVVTGAHRRVIRDGTLGAAQALPDSSSYDVVVSGGYFIERHEIKHKTVTPDGCYGLEEYRLRKLIAANAFTREEKILCFYTVLDHACDEWRTVPVVDLQRAAYAKLPGVRRDPAMPTYFGGEADRRAGWYWPARLWRPISTFWGRPR